VLSLLRRVRACLRNEEVIHSRWLGRVTVAFFASGCTVLSAGASPRRARPLVPSTNRHTLDE